MGDVKKWVNAGGLWDPAGSANRVAVQNSSHPIGGTVGNLETSQQNKGITLHNTLDPGGVQRQNTNTSGFSRQYKNSLDPFGTLHNTGHPNTLGNVVNDWHHADPVFGSLGDAIAKHNNTDQTNLRGVMDPGQVLGPNAQMAAPYNPNAPGSINNMFGNHGSIPFTPPPPPGSSTNGLGGGYNGASNPGFTQGGTSPNWQAIIANALRPPGQPNGMPMNQPYQNPMGAAPPMAQPQPMQPPNQSPQPAPQQQTTQPLPGQMRQWG